MEENNSVLITGAAGFLGSHLCDYFLNLNYKVIGIDNLVTGNINNLNHLNNNNKFQFINQDICNKINLDVPLKYILHFASPASPIDYLEIPIKTLKVSSIGTHNVFDLANKNTLLVDIGGGMEVIGRNIQLRQQGLGVQRHLYLTGHRFTQLTAIGDQHRQGHPVVLDQGRQRIDGHPDRRVLHDDCRTLAPHPGSGTQPHALVLFVGGNMKNLVARLNFLDHPGQLFAGNCGDK